MSCNTGKMIFATQRKAADGAHHLARLRGVSYHFYFCRPCQGYHVGRWGQDKQRQAARRAEGLPVRGETDEED